MKTFYAEVNLMNENILKPDLLCDNEGVFLKKSLLFG